MAACAKTLVLFTVPPQSIHTYIPAENFLGLICRLGTRVTSTFQTLSQKPEAYFQSSQTSAIRSFLAKIVNGLKPLNILTKKIHCRCSTRFCNTPL